ncbi:MAG: hypothetical protein ACREJ3_11425 [Polyangiaceae bacterium]
MSSKFFPTIESWQLPRAALVASLDEMARDGRDGNEGIAFWLGRRTGGVASISHVVCLRGNDVVREPAHLHVGAGTLNDVADLAIEHGVSIVGQIHSHGPYFGVDLSVTDRRYGIAVPHFLSVVAPDYALRPGTRIEDCGVHVFEAGAGYRRLDVGESVARVLVSDHLGAMVLVAGSERP